MSICSKSPKKIAKVAYELGKKTYQDYSHEFSPKKFTQAQLYACLVLKMFFKTDYRGIGAILKDSRELCEVIGMKEVPHFTTLQKAEKRLLSSASSKRMFQEFFFFDRKEKD